MNVLPGTWTAETIEEKANRTKAKTKNGPKSIDRRRAHAPTIMNGTRTIAPTRIE
jgi:hypothetical protein